MFQYECITGHFSAADPNHQHIASQPPAFGLLHTGPERWKTLRESFEALQKSAKEEHPGAQVKLILLGRHGQGYHNLKAAEVGNKLFLEVYGRQTTDGQITWGPDPPLTPLGEDQARQVNKILEEERAHGMPLPTSFYASPLHRACRTLQLAYETVPGSHKVKVLENLREGINIWIQREWKIGSLEGTDPNVDCVFTDTKRSHKDDIAQRYPSFSFEEGFSEPDPWWKPEHKESIEAHTDRTRKVLDRIFSDDPADVVAIAAHGGTCLTMQRLLGLPLQVPHTAAVLPLIIKAVPKST